MANVFVTDAVIAILERFNYKLNLFIPRKKELIANTERINPEIGSFSRKIMGSVQIEEKVVLLKRLTDLTIKTYGFFEWESEREEVIIEGNDCKKDKFT